MVTHSLTLGVLPQLPHLTRALVSLLRDELDEAAPANSDGPSAAASSADV